MEKPISQDEAFALALAFYNRECEDVLLSLEQRDGIRFRTLESFTQQGPHCAYKGTIVQTSASNQEWDDVRAVWEKTGSMAGMHHLCDRMLSISLLITKDGMAGTILDETTKSKQWIHSGDDFRKVVMVCGQPFGLNRAFERAVTGDPHLELLEETQSVYTSLDTVLRCPLLKEDALEALPTVLEWTQKLAQRNNVEIKPGQERETALWVASAGEMVGFMRLLIDYAGVDVNSGQGRALRWAAGKGKKGAVNFLLSRKADPYLRNDQGDTSIVLAREAGYPEISREIEAYALKHAAPSERGRARRTTLPPTL